MAKVITDFRDRETMRLYAVGDEYDGPRADELTNGGYLETDAPKPVTRKRPARKPKE